MTAFDPIAHREQLSRLAEAVTLRVLPAVFDHHAFVLARFPSRSSHAPTQRMRRV